MKICFIPIDNRPVCYNLAKDICAVDKSIELIIPPREFLGNLVKSADTKNIMNWMKDNSDSDCLILSLDTLVYGGLIPSRRTDESLYDIKQRLETIKPLLKNKKVYAFSSIMRISNNNYNEEEKDYWNLYGKKIFNYSYELSKTGKASQDDIPKEILEDYLLTRKRNFEINKIYLSWQKEGLFDTLIFSKDDCAEYGFNVDEAKQLEILGGKTKTGADEIPLSLLARAIEKEIKIFVKYTEPDYKNCISNYEDVSIEKSVDGQLDLCGFIKVSTETEADMVLVVNNFKSRQGEHVMGWETEQYGGKFVYPQKPFAVADVRYANGADNKFVQELFESHHLPEYGYSGWNTSANTLGSLLAWIKIAYHAEKYDNNAFKKLYTIRLLDDWAYQANVRKQSESLCDTGALMKPFEERITSELQINSGIIEYIHPWNRTFEIEVCLE